MKASIKLTEKSLAQQKRFTIDAEMTIISVRNEFYMRQLYLLKVFNQKISGTNKKRRKGNSRLIFFFFFHDFELPDRF